MGHAGLVEGGGERGGTHHHLDRYSWAKRRSEVVAVVVVVTNVVVRMYAWVMRLSCRGLRLSAGVERICSVYGCSSVV